MLNIFRFVSGTAVTLRVNGGAGMENKNVFQRIEKKYLLTPQAGRRLIQKLNEYMVQDIYGLHTITSVYFDTEDFALIRNSVQKPLFKEKLRLRWYGVPTPKDNLFLELKRKYNGVVYKRRIAVEYAQAERILKCDATPLKQGQIAQEMDWFVRRYRPTPKLLLAYEREAMAGRDDESLRITFDYNIRWRRDDWDLSKGSYGTPLLKQDAVLMEIKAFGSLPIWLTSMLAEERIYPSSFSKYGTWYTQEILQEGMMLHVG